MRLLLLIIGIQTRTAGVRAHLYAWKTSIYVINILINY